MGLEVHGVRVSVAAPPSLRAALLRRFPPGARRSSSTGAQRRYALAREVDGHTVLRVAGRRRARSRLSREVLDAWESDLQLFVARRAVGRVFVHAGVVAVGGRALVLPGRSGSGKTTLVRALVSAGARYASDEFAVLDAQGRVWPYARPPHVKTADGVRRARAALGRGRPVRRPLTLAWVVATRYAPGRSWRPRVLTAGGCALVLLANTVPARERTAEVLQTLSKAVQQVGGWQVYRGNAQTAAQALLALVRGHEVGRVQHVGKDPLPL
jgi:hypothetical protein